MNVALELDELRLASLKLIQNRHMFTSILEPLNMNLSYSQQTNAEMSIDANIAKVEMNVSYKDLDIIFDVLAALSPSKEDDTKEVTEDPTMRIEGLPIHGDEWYLKGSTESDAMSMLSLRTDRGRNGRFSPSATLLAKVRFLELFKEFGKFDGIWCRRTYKTGWVAAQRSLRFAALISSWWMMHGTLLDRCCCCHQPCLRAPGTLAQQPSRFK